MVASLRTPRRLYLSVNTNGLLVNPEIARTLRQADCTFALSLDGPPEVHDRERTDRGGRPTADRVWRSLRLLLDEGCRVVVLTTLRPRSFQGLTSFASALHGIGVRNWVLKLPTFEPPDSALYLSEEVPAWAAKLTEVIRACNRQGMDVSGLPDAKFTGCEGIGHMLCVEPNGEVFPCPGGIRQKLGTYDRLEEIPGSPAYLHVAGRTLQKLRECRQCLAAGYCAGGCAADAERACGTIYGRNPLICEFQRQLTMAALRAVAGDGSGCDRSKNDEGEAVPSCAI